jgi:hypothetical protein
MKIHKEERVFQNIQTGLQGGFCECGNYILNSIKCGEFHEKIRYYFNIKNAMRIVRRYQVITQAFHSLEYIHNRCIRSPSTCSGNFWLPSSWFSTIILLPACDCAAFYWPFQLNWLVEFCKRNFLSLIMKAEVWIDFWQSHNPYHRILSSVGSDYWRMRGFYSVQTFNATGFKTVI